MAPPLLTLQDIHLTFGGTPLLEGAELSIGERERVCLVGRNGSGKSTLLKIAAGTVEADRGKRFAQPGATIRYLPQEPDLTGFATTLAYVEAGLAPGDDPHRARYLLEQLGLTGDEDPARLSGGEARRAALARVLAPEPDILLLDEPTNHLDLPAIEWLEDELASSRSALVLISHDRRFLDKALARDGVARPRRHAAHRARLCGVRGMARSGAGGRRARAAQARPQDRRRGALDALRRHRAAQAQHAPRRPAGGSCARISASIAARSARVKIAVSEAELSGKLVVEAERISKSFGAEPIVRDFSIRIQRGDRIGARRPERRGQDHAAEHADRRARARRRHGDARREPRRWRRSTSAARRSTRTRRCATR